MNTLPAAALVATLRDIAASSQSTARVNARRALEDGAITPERVAIIARQHADERRRWGLAEADRGFDDTRFDDTDIAPVWALETSR